MERAEEEEEAEPRERSEPAFSGLYSVTVMFSRNVTENGVCESALLLRSDESEWTPFRALDEHRKSLHIVHLRTNVPTFSGPWTAL